MRSVFMQTPVVVKLVMTLCLEGSKKTMHITSKTPLGVIEALTTFFLPVIATSVTKTIAPHNPRSRVNKKTTDLEN